MNKFISVMILAIGLTGSAGAYRATGTETENDEKR